jgi:hypothetical protein
MVFWDVAPWNSNCVTNIAVAESESPTSLNPKLVRHWARSWASTIHLQHHNKLLKINFNVIPLLNFILDLLSGRFITNIQCAFLVSHNLAHPIFLISVCYRWKTSPSDHHVLHCVMAYSKLFFLTSKQFLEHPVFQGRSVHGNRVSPANTSKKKRKIKSYFRTDQIKCIVR